VEQSQTQRDAEATLENLRVVGPPEATPYSFLGLDQVRDELSAETSRISFVKAEATVAANLKASVQRMYAKSQRNRRLAKETLARNRDAQAAHQLNAKLLVAQLHCQVTEQVMHLRTAEVSNHETRLAISETRVAYLQEKIATLQGDVVYPEQDFQDALQSAEQTESELQAYQLNVERMLADARQKWMAARGQVEHNAESNGASKEIIASWQLVHGTYQTELAFINQRLAELVISRVLCERRYRLFHGKATRAEELEWQQSSKEFRDRLQQAHSLLKIRGDGTRNDLATLAKRSVKVVNEDSKVAPWITFQTQHLQRLENVYGAHLVRIETTLRQVDRFSEELGIKTQPVTARQWWDTASTLVVTIWKYELTAIDDRPITVGKITGGLLLLLVGLLVARFLSRLAGKRILPRLGVDEGGAATLQTIAYYLMLAIFGFFTLELINIPITVFAFMGGAIAIGVGFGSQNILNNFISGLILLAERPIRLGDLIHLDGLFGTIEHIGARSTRVRTGDNLEIIVPNSRFLENNVTNLTLTNSRIRALVRVGVSYGSPVRQVKEALYQAASESPEVLNDPQPVILFGDFGNDSLQFEVHFWISMRTQMDRMRIESGVRFEICSHLEERNITIAFPQRDVHLDLAHPLEVNLSPPAVAASLLETRRAS
jgi:potassium efflux system protein